MYRQYEDPYKLEKELEQVEDEYRRFLDDGGIDEDGSWQERIGNLKERINFAWQDDEYEENYMRENYGDEEWMNRNVYSSEEIEDHYFYRISIGSGGAWVDSYVIETDAPTTDYGALVDILIDYLRENDPDSLLDPDTYMFDDNGNIFFIDDPDDIIYQDTFVEGGNYGDVLMHYGDFRIDEIPEDQITENDIIVPEVW